MLEECGELWPNSRDWLVEVSVGWDLGPSLLKCRNLSGGTSLRTPHPADSYDTSLLTGNSCYDMVLHIRYLIIGPLTPVTYMTYHPVPWRLDVSSRKLGALRALRNNYLLLSTTNGYQGHYLQRSQDFAQVVCKPVEVDIKSIRGSSSVHGKVSPVYMRMYAVEGKNRGCY
ncbi:hypothetical protein GOBAR_AA40269 [Gossypium barbadense]|uniref:Uncharacterized protein n=1 Tax=Gossypium barbadense TaxID=3634 RepID=A0A2P5VNL7_GOSBA|nr:hypothetical protein GOBAR_AA40269 [Gossypium barbadense]